MNSQTYHLNMRTGPTPGKIFPLHAGESTIGRDASNSLPIPDPEVSRHHARIYIQGGYHVLEDLGSTNGTFVNGQRIAGQYVLQAGDAISLGETISLIFEMVAFDPDATLVSTPPYGYQTPASPPPQVGPAYIPPPPVRPQPQPVYSGQVPPGPDEYMDEIEPPRNRNLPYILAGCGCLTVLCVVVLGVLWYIDANYLWCNVFSFIPGCP